MRKCVCGPTSGWGAAGGRQDGGQGGQLMHQTAPARAAVAAGGRGCWGRGRQQTAAAMIDTAARPAVLAERA